MYQLICRLLYLFSITIKYNISVGIWFSTFLNVISTSKAKDTCSVLSLLNLVAVAVVAEPAVAAVVVAVVEAVVVVATTAYLT